MGIPITELQSTLARTKPDDLKQTIVNLPFDYRVDMVLMGIGIIVLLICDQKAGQIHRVALSRTEMAEGTTKISLKKFEDIIIPAGYDENIIVQAISTGEPQVTTDWRYLFAPALSPEQARLNQAGGGIAGSYVYPLTFNENGGALIYSYYKDPNTLDGDEREFMEAYSLAVSERLAADDVNLDQLLGRS